MEYKYNGNLLYEDRIAQISKELMNEYNFITKSEAMLISTLESPISTDVDDLIKFRRLYNIIYIKRDKYTFDIIIKDILKLDRTNEIISNGIIRLLEYKDNNIFPDVKDIFKIDK